jgi:pilus assembly protein FimV
VHKLIAKSHPFQLTALAVAALLGLWGTQAAALSLGRITVQSALGEPLKAEIDILDISPEEAASLSAKVAAPDAFVSAGLDYNPALASLRTSLQRRSDGRAFLRLSSDRAVNDPFVDMILETSWATGRIVRDYTLLFDPPSLRQQAAGAPVNTQLPAPTPERAATPAAAARANATPQPRPVLPAREPAKPAVATPKPAVAELKPAPAPAPEPQPQDASGASVKVKAGDTAGALAAAHKPANVSLDQMLVAMLRANPNAFIRDNVNRIKAGAIVSMPSEERALATAPEQATQLIVAQSQDFNAYRRKFAANAPDTELKPAGREVSGKVQTMVQDKKAPAPVADKLTLSKGSVQGKSGEEALAKARNAEDAASRAEELSKNIKDLKQLAAAASAPAAPVASAPALAVPAATPSEPVVAAKASEPTPAAAVVASAPKKPLAAVAVAAEPVAETSLVDDLLDNPMLPAGGGGLIALLLGWGWYKARQRKQAESVDSSFSESSLVFAGASGGQNVDTGDSLTTGSSMVYSPSQLDAVDDVDPVAEADVYLAYGRDLQAEEILKDALRSNPKRVAIHQKLLEIYAKRRDAKAFEAIAALAFNLTDGSGPEWEQICEKGIAIDPDNALYLPGGQPLPSQLPEFDRTEPGFAPSRPPASDNAAAVDDPIPTSHAELDLDLDFSLDEPAPVPQAPPAAAPAVEALAEPTEMSVSQFDALPTFAAEFQPEPEPKAEPKAEPEETPEEPPTVRDELADNLDFDLPKLDQEPAAAGQPGTEPATPAAADSELMSFDLGSLSLDLGEDRVTVPGAFADDGMDPLETKLALAEEFRAIGDDDGARALIEEVIAEAAGDLRFKAQDALAKL